MASTRNRNTRGDYFLEQKSYESQINYKSSILFGENKTTHLPGDSLLTGRIANTLLSHNAHDVESQLFGIGSTNLIYAKPDTVPYSKHLDSLTMMDSRVPLILPIPLVVQKGQRPYRA
jgi:hypothetical protein